RRTDLGPAALEEERRALTAELDVSRSGRWRMEWPGRDAARLVEDHERVVIRLAVIGGVKGSHPDRIFDVERRRIRASRRRCRGAREGLDRCRRHQYWAERVAAGCLNRCNDCGI